MTDHPLNMAEAALIYANRGLPVFPLKARGKEPLTINGFKDASCDKIQVKNRWEVYPEANIGIPTGVCFWVLDIDGIDGESSLKSLEGQHSPLPQTYEVITGGGGRHVYFQLPAKKEIKNSVGKIGKNIDVRGIGGYVVAPPSLHTSGKRYEVSVDSLDTIEPAPDWLIALVTNSQTQRAATPPTDWQRLLKGVSEGSRNDALARISGKLLSTNLDAFCTLELCLAWNEARCQPPLSHDEVIRTVNSIAGIELAKREVKNGKY
jgi:hypothetical protein